MSEKDWTIRLSDILDCIAAIQSYTAGMTYDDFEKNRLVFDGVVRNIEVIGEASKNIPQDFLESYAEVPWRSIKGMRDIIVHEYAGVSKESVWGVVRERLPELKTVVLRMISDCKKCQS